MHPHHDAPIVISLGGSLVVPNQIDIEFLKRFKDIIERQLASGKQFVIVVGGGRTARTYIDAAHDVTEISDEDKDWLGIHSTRLNAHMLRTIFYQNAHPEIVTNPNEIPYFTAPILIGAGYRPGNSTDFVAVKLAAKLHSTHVINLSNIEQVYTADPRTNPHAQPITSISWNDYIAIIPETWSPGLSTPFDPVASRAARDAHITVSIINGADLSRLEQCLAGETFLGSTIAN